MDEKLKELEEVIIQQSLAKLEELTSEYKQHKFLDGVDLKSLEEMVKLAHRVRSLLA